MAASVKQQHLLNIIEQNCDTYKNPFSPDEVTEMVYNRLEREHGDVDFKNWFDTLKGF